MEGLAFASVSLVAGAVVWWFGIRLSRRTTAIVEAWAARDGYRLIEARRALIRFGPFGACVAAAVPILRIRVLTADGNLRTGWAQVTTGISESVEIRIDDEETTGVPGSSRRPG